MSEELKPCPFCGGECDPEGWLSGTEESPIRGPECEDCGATASSLEEWNHRIDKGIHTCSPQVGAHENDAMAFALLERLGPHALTGGKMTLIEAFEHGWQAATQSLVPEWLPIESAPKDGASILIIPPTWKEKNASIAKFYDDKYAKNPRPFWKRDDDLGLASRSRSIPPTHWMPLPAAPSHKEE